MTTAKAGTNRVDPRLDAPEVRSAAIRTVVNAVTAKLPAGRVEVQFKRLWPRRLGPPSEADAQDVMAPLLETLMFAGDPRGRTAFDRLARQQPYEPGTIEAAALDLLRTARFRVLEVVENSPGSAVRVRDLVTGTPAMLEPCTVVAGERVAGRFVQLADDSLAVVSAMLRIGPQAWPTAQAQIASARNKALRNPERAAEAIYAAVIAAAVGAGVALAEMFVGLLAEEDAGHGPNVRFVDGRWQLAADAPAFLRDLVDLAETWTRLDSPVPERADPEGARWLRQEATPDDVYTLAALTDHVPASGAAERALEAMMRIALDTVERRAALGLGEGMAQFEADLREPGDGLTPSAWRRVRRLRASLGGAGAASDPDLDRVIARIRALQAKTQAAGCTEAEAMAAAAKAEELLRRYDIQFTPEQIAQTECTSARIATPRKRQDALDQCAHAVARFCGCRHWLQYEASDRLTHVLFGFPADVAAAETLFQVISETFEVETATFKDGDTYRRTPSGQRASATKSFRLGLAKGIGDKLVELEKQRVSHTRSTNGRDLVPIKAQTMEAALARLGLSFQTTRRRRRAVDPGAYHQGVASGRAFQPERGVPAGADGS